jgi:uncharacterized protein (DUF1697 family)
VASGDDVESYIQSGNRMLSADAEASEVEAIIESLVRGSSLVGLDPARPNAQP